MAKCKLEGAVPARKRPRRNKLFYKNRWLVSRDMVAALRRAGVVCDIVIPEQPVGNPVEGPQARWMN